MRAAPHRSALAAAAGLALAAAAPQGCRSSPRLEGPPPVVEVRLAEYEPTDGYLEARARDGSSVWIAPQPIVDLGDFSSAFIRRQGRDDFLLLNLRAGSRIRLDAATLGHLERPIAFMIDGRVVYVPELRTSIARQMPVRIGSRGISPEEAQRLIDAVDDARDFPSRRPAGATTAAAPAAPAAPPAAAPVTAPEAPSAAPVQAPEAAPAARPGG